MFLALLTDPQREAFLHLAHNVVVSDGELTAGEETMLLAMRSEMNINADFEAAYLDITGIGDVFPDRRGRSIVLLGLIQLAYADGAFEIEEQCFLRDLATAFAVDGREFSLMTNWVRRQQSLVREAQAFF